MSAWGQGYTLANERLVRFALGAFRLDKPYPHLCRVTFVSISRARYMVQGSMPHAKDPSPRFPFRLHGPRPSNHICPILSACLTLSKYTRLLFPRIYMSPTP